MFTKGKFESTQMQNLCTFCYQQNLKLQFVFTISHIVSLHWRNKDNFQNLISKNSFSLYDWTEIFILAYTNITFSLYTYYNLVEFSAILSGYDHFSRERREKGIDILLLVFQVDQGITFYMQGHAIWWNKIRQIAYCVPMKVFHQKVFIWCICTQNIILKLMPCFVFLVEFQHQFSNTFHVIKLNVFRYFVWL